MSQRYSHRPTVTYGGMGGYFEPPQTCPHTEVTKENFIALCVDNFGGSFQGLVEKLTEKGYRLTKTD